MNLMLGLVINSGAAIYAKAVPSNVITLNGVPITLGPTGPYITLGP